MKNRFLKILLTAAVTLNSLAVTVPAAYAEDMKNTYALTDLDFEDSADYDWAEIEEGAALSGSAARITKSVNLIDREYIGKTGFEFDFVADAIGGSFSAAIGGGTEKFVTVSAAESNGEIAVRVNGVTAGNVLKGEKVHVRIVSDLSAKTADLTVKTNSRSIYSGSVEINTYTDIVSTIGFYTIGTNSVYIDNIKIEREKHAGGTQAVISRAGNYFTAETAADEGNVLYLVQYRDGAMLDVKKTKCTGAYTEIFVADNSEQGDLFKAFVLAEDLEPQAAAAEGLKENIVSAEISLNGTLTAGTLTEDTAADFTVGLPDGYSEYKIIVEKDGKKSAAISNAKTWTPSVSGDYTAWLYVTANGRDIPCAKLDLFVYPNLTADDTFMFPAEADYYVHNGVRKYYTDYGFAPLFVQDELYLDADMLMQVIGVRVKDNAATYQGKRIISDMSKITQKNGAYSFAEIAAKLDYSDWMYEDVLCVSRTDSANPEDYRELLHDYIVNDPLDGDNLSWDKHRYPDGWGFFDWTNTGDRDAWNFGETTEDKTTGTHSAWMGALKQQGTPYAGFGKSLSITDFDGYAYAVSFDVKLSDDFDGNYPIAFLAFSNENGGFMGHLFGSTVSGKKGEWTRVTSYFNKESLDGYKGFGKVDLYIGLRSTSTTATGKAYFDDVTFREVSVLTEAYEAEIACDEFASWHKTGETVKYKPLDKRLNVFDKIKGVVYNSDNEQVYEKTVSYRQFAKNGWTYKSSEPGYYEAEFYGIRADGTSSLIVNCYTISETGGYHPFTLARRGFAVVDGEAKKMEDRSDFLLVSDHADDKEHLKLIEMLGFSGIRIHGISWGSTVTTRGFEPDKRGEFYWDYADTQVNNCVDLGFKNIIANVFSTPSWAVSADVPNNYTVVGWWWKNCYKADNNEDIANAYGAFTERYKDKIDGIEVWNEPYYGYTAFWRDTPENFIELAKTAYDAIKAKDPDMTVYSAGFNQANGFYEEVMESEEFRNAFDAISFHGAYEDYDEYRTELDKYEMYDVPIINSEGYYYAHKPKDKPKDQVDSSLRMYMSYLDHIKNNVDMAGIFEITNLNEPEKNFYQGGHSMGLFRDYPYTEPQHGAVTAYNLNKTLGNELSYIGEYDLGGGTKAIAIDSDGECQLYIWNADDKAFSLPEKIKACLTSGSTIKDYEGKTADEKDLKAKKIYIIRNLSRTALNEIDTDDGFVINRDYESPFYNCRNVYGETVEHYTSVEGVFTEGTLFSQDDFTEVDEAKYNTDGFVWSGIDGAACDVDAKFALSANDDGVYIIVNTTDNEICTKATRPQDITNYDGLRIGIDCYGRMSIDERTEFFVGYVNGKPTLYKHFAAEWYNALPENCSSAGTTLSSNYINIEKNGNETVYKIFLPVEEIYPLHYRDGSGNKIRMALAVSDNDGGVKKGDYTFGAGLCEENARVWKYAELSEFANSKGFDIKLRDGIISVSATPETAYTTIVLWYNDDVENMDQINNDGTKFTKTFRPLHTGKYIITIADETNKKWSKEIYVTEK